jgi:hypothetical protein
MMLHLRLRQVTMLIMFINDAAVTNAASFINMITDQSR